MKHPEKSEEGCGRALASGSGSALPCPFCGSTKITVEWEPCPSLVATDTNRRWFAECTQCSCQGPFCQKEPQVIPAWNHRVPVSDSTSISQELKDAAIAVAVTYCAIRCGFQDHTQECDRLKRALQKADVTPNAELSDRRGAGSLE